MELDEIGLDRFLGKISPSTSGSASTPSGSGSNSGTANAVSQSAYNKPAATELLTGGNSNAAYDINTNTLPITIPSGGPLGNARLGFAGGSRIWEDPNKDMGINAIGGDLYIYTNSQQIALFHYVPGAPASGSVVFGLDNYPTTPSNFFEVDVKVIGNFNVGSKGSVGTPILYRPNARFNGGLVKFSNYSDTEYITSPQVAGTPPQADSGIMQYNAYNVHQMYVDTVLASNLSSTGLTVYGTNGLYVHDRNGMDFKNYKLTLTADKTAIVPTSEGFNALYCTESPEVWFMDFCDEKGVLDPMFEEVTVAPYRYIKCEDGGYQVWGKRKGHEHKRFEQKTEAEFLANEKFLRMSKQ